MSTGLRPFQVEGSAHIVMLGVLLDGSIQESWVLDCVRQALTVQGVRLGTVGLVSMNCRRSLPARLHRLYDRVAEPKRTRNDHLFAPVDITADLAAPIVRIQAVVGNAGWMPDQAGGESLRRCGVDVWLCFTAIPPRRRMCPVSAHGVWGLEIGRNVPATAGWAGAMEFSARSPVTMIGVIDYAATDAEVLYRSFGATVGDSARRNRLRALRKGVTFPRRLLERLTRNRKVSRCERSATLDDSQGCPAEPVPTVSTLLKLAARVASNRIGDCLPSLRSTRQWQIGYYFTDQIETGCSFERLQYLVPPSDRFWADPFAVLHGGRHYIFLEEMPYETQKGRLVAIEVFENAKAGEAVVVLERPYHLSYPFVFCWEGTLYLLPETAGNRTIELYRCEDFPHQWGLEKVLLDNISAFDATLWQQGDRWWMFVNVAEPGADCNDELHLYWSANPLGPWTAHRLNPVVSDVRAARGAGPIFSNQGKLYRPSQDCSLAYGHSVVVNRIDVLTADDYREAAVGRIAPGWREDVLRVHTFGGTGRLRVIDCLVSRRQRWWRFR